MGQTESKVSQCITFDEDESLQTEKELNKDYGKEADVQKWEELHQDVEKLFGDVCSQHSIAGRIYETCRSALLSPVRSFITELIDNARPPVIYIMGRSGHGKSSLINALTKQNSAEVGHVTPTTPYAREYNIRFEGQNCAWTVVDSRGIFETTKPEESKNISAMEEVKQDLDKYKPDIILHVVCSTEARSLHNDLQFLQEVFHSLKTSLGAIPPVISILTKADVIGHTRQWPPEVYPQKQQVLEDLMDYLSTDALHAKESKPLQEGAGYYGYQLEECVPFLYIIPTATIQEEPKIRWNIDELSLLIGSKIPCQAWLHYYKAQKDKKIMKGLTTQIIAEFSVIAAGVGAIPGPGVSIALITPLTIIMVALIARLAGSDFSKKSVWECIRAFSTGVTGCVTGTAMLVSLLAMAEVVEFVLVGIGCIAGAAAAGLSTFCVGKAAEAFFFEGSAKNPEYYKKEWKPPL